MGTAEASSDRKTARRPRTGRVLVAVGLLLAGLVIGVGSGFTATRQLLGDGSAYLAKGHTVAHVNGENGRSDAEVAQQLATGREELQTVRLPDGQLAVVNKKTGVVTFIDTATLTSKGQSPPRPQAKGLEPVATSREGYLVDKRQGTVEKIVAPGQRPPEPVRVADGIRDAVPAKDKVWVLANNGQLLRIQDGKPEPQVPVDGTPTGVTVADGAPVTVTTDGRVYTVDGDEPRGIGRIEVTGSGIKLGSWRGAGRYVVAVDPNTNTVAALDPRTGRSVTVKLPLKKAATLDAPVMLGDHVYVPDYAAPRLWRVNLATGTADAEPITVPGDPGPFTLEVTGGRVWANSQYAQRVLVVDEDGHAHRADKGAGSGVTDSDAPKGDPAGGEVKPPKTGDKQTPSRGTPTGTTPPARRVTVPTIARGTPYEEACATIQAANLRCRTVAAGDEDGIPTGGVIGTRPAGGTSVPEGSRVIVRYAGPLSVPEVTGLAPDEACRRVTEAKLRCETRIDSNPADSPERLGLVSTQDPPAGGLAQKDAIVTITYVDRIALPSLVGQPHGEACTRLTRTYRLRTCTATAGEAAVGAGKVAGQVYAQDPPAGTVVRMGGSVSLTYYDGAAQVDDYRGQQVDAACATVLAKGFTCTRVEGRSAAGTGQQPGIVYDQDVPAGQRLDIGRAVTLTFYSGSSDLGSYVGADINAACAEVAALGFQCNAVQQLFPSTNVVAVQDQPAGRYPIGSIITLRYSPWAMVEYWKYQHNTENVWVLRSVNQGAPDRYGRQAFRVGFGYGLDVPIPGGRRINGFYCMAGGTSCNGLPVNHFYSRIDLYNDRAWEGPTNAATFMDCSAGGQRIYRTWNGGEPKYYDITPTPGAGLVTEELGCVWP